MKTLDGRRMDFEEWALENSNYYVRTYGAPLINELSTIGLGGDYYEPRCEHCSGLLSVNPWYIDASKFLTTHHLRVFRFCKRCFKVSIKDF